ncbi:serine/threonine protein kinase [Archangium violaceum]|uniref:serine/threonine-protein kinase n=1 Tax=Archangium violaceum TaxID=83451 RepID=UPI0019529F57|nr:serine/threonine-protein kinase [Archangium violaceum]QRN94044.1 serine/threonine protein kinase [Archangium violaceum]
MKGPARNDSFPIRPMGPDGLLFEGPEYRYTLVAPLRDGNDPLAIAWRTSPRGQSIPCLVILKRVEMLPEEERRQRAVEEVWLATRLRHPGIAQVYELVEHQGELYVVMEHTPGLFLATAMETALLLGRTLAPAHAVYIAAEVADALHCAWNSQDGDGHPLHVVHRAVSPMSIRLESSGRVKLTDFGVAYSRMAGRLDTPSRVLRAELAYAAPEVMRRQKPDGRADLYSLGMVLLEMLSGQYPLDPPDVNLPAGESPDVVRYNARMRAERPSWTSAGALADRILRFGPEDVERVAQKVPEPLKRILHRALRAHPDDRYQTGGEMRDELCAWLRGQGKRFGRSRAAAELRALVREKPAPQETRAFPLERGVLPTPEEEATAEEEVTEAVLPGPR